MTRLLTLAAAVTLLLAAPAAPATAPQWRPIPLTGSAPRVLGFAAGRVWIASGSTVLSATVSGGRLGGFVATTIAGASPWLFGDALVSGSTMTPLLANGQLGAAAPLPAPAQAAVTAGGRTIWVAAGAAPASLTVCCTQAGDPVALTPLLAGRPARPGSPALGLDTENRLWVAWTDAGQTGHLVQLDPATLNGVTANTVSPVRGPAYLGCAATCRLFYESSVGVFAWRGIGGAALILATPGSLLAAGVRDGHLELATRERQRLVFRRGAPTGTGLRVVASIGGVTARAAAAGTPRGLVAVQADGHRVEAAVLG